MDKMAKTEIIKKTKQFKPLTASQKTALETRIQKHKTKNKNLNHQSTITKILNFLHP